MYRSYDKKILPYVHRKFLRQLELLILFNNHQVTPKSAQIKSPMSPCKVLIIKRSNCVLPHSACKQLVEIFCLIHVTGNKSEVVLVNFSVV